ncbi:MAG TPA: hypothetical protein VFV50_12345, partial [Bdellovibrionales bacterium]|nr:hypothetical protein [Bdellovibrionales bacterium]
QLDDDVIVAYGDIIFEEHLLAAAQNTAHDFGVVVDLDWKALWTARYGRVDFDLESLSIQSGLITSLGEPNPSVDEIDARYVGLLRFSKRGCEIIKDLYDRAKRDFEGKVWLGGRPFEKVYMTDLLQELIRQGHPVSAIGVKRGWWEFDINEDYELFQRLNASGELKSFIDVSQRDAR